MKEYRDEEKCVTHFEIRLSAEQIAALQKEAQPAPEHMTNRQQNALFTFGRYAGLSEHETAAHIDRCNNEMKT